MKVKMINKTIHKKMKLIGKMQKMLDNKFKVRMNKEMRIWNWRKMMKMKMKKKMNKMNRAHKMKWKMNLKKKRM